MFYTKDSLKQHCNNVLQCLGINAECVDSNIRDNYISCDLSLKPGTRISKIKNLSNEISLLLRTKKAISMTTIHGEGIVRLTGTIGDPSSIDWNQLLQKHWVTKPKGIQVLVGESIEGVPIWMNIKENPHLLIGGATGSGKSVLLHNIILNLLLHDNIILNMIDTKCVEFETYKNPKFKNSIHHIISTIGGAANLLSDMIKVMNSRYEIMSRSNVDYEKLGFKTIVIVIDEFADLLMEDKSFEKMIITLAQKARMAGIFMIIATQRPSVDVVSGSIKANFPARIACRVISKFDSRVILDQDGAENLAGKGDCLIKSSQFDLVRFKAPFADPRKIGS